MNSTTFVRCFLFFFLNNQIVWVDLQPEPAHARCAPIGLSHTFAASRTP